MRFLLVPLFRGRPMWHRSVMPLWRGKPSIKRLIPFWRQHIRQA
nr:MAG TPA_asm: hypothetical protein [Caudoviricetes sp.]